MQYKYISIYIVFVCEFALDRLKIFAISCDVINVWLKNEVLKHLRLIFKHLV